MIFIFPFQAGLCSEETCGTLLQASLSNLELPSSPAPDNLLLVLESEAAFVFCRDMTQQDAAKYCQVNYPYKASSFLVVDITEKAIDVSAHCVSPTTGHITFVHRPVRNHCMVNREFRKFFETLVNDPGLSKYLNMANSQTNAKNNADLDSLLEKLKRLFDSQEGRVVVVRLPHSFMSTYDDVLESGLQQYSPDVKLCGQCLRVSYSQMQKLYQPFVDGLLSYVSTVLTEAEAKIEALYVVGDFVGCYIYTAINNRFGNAYRCIVPAEPHLAVVRGAAIYQQNSELQHHN